MIIAEYNMQDELIDYFENYMEMSRKTGHSVETCQCIVSRQKNGFLDKSWDNYRKQYVRFYKIKIDEEEL